MNYTPSNSEKAYLLINSESTEWEQVLSCATYCDECGDIKDESDLISGYNGEVICVDCNQMDHS